MAAPAVVKKRSLWWSGSPSALTTGRKCKAAKDASGNPHPIEVIYLPYGQLAAEHSATTEEIQQIRKDPETGQVLGIPGMWTDPRHFPATGVGYVDTGRIYTDPFGQRIISPLDFRRLVSKRLSLAYKLGEPVMFDWEKIPMNWIADFLLGRPDTDVQGWRGVHGNTTGGANPTRESSWTDAIFQMGGYNRTVLSLLAQSGFAFFVQLYTEPGMAALFEREDAVREAIEYGFPGEDVLPMYDCADDIFKRNYFLKGCGFLSDRWIYLFT